MTLYNKDSPSSIQSLFDHIADKYDKTNAILSLQMHKKWNQQLIKEILVEKNPKSFLDLCCGTGAIAFNYLSQSTDPKKVFLLDFSANMLECAKKRAQSLQSNQHQIKYLQADAQMIPLPSESIDCVTTAYGIRNVKDPQACIQEVYRVLNPNGTFGILELTQPKNPLLKLGHHLYLTTILPLIGKLLTSNRDAYEYLCTSIHTFIPPEKLIAIMIEEGFHTIQQKNFFGGTATLLIGKK